jgi:hypothetical protein
MKVGNSTGMNAWTAYTTAVNIADAGVILNGLMSPTDTVTHGVNEGAAIAHGIGAVVTGISAAVQNQSPALWTQTASEGLKCGGAAAMACGAPVVGALVYGSGIIGSIFTNFIDE